MMIMIKKLLRRKIKMMIVIKILRLLKKIIMKKILKL